MESVDYQASAYWLVLPSEQSTALDCSFTPGLSYQKSLLASELAQYANLIRPSVLLPPFKSFGPLLHQRCASSVELFRTPALTASSLASTPQTVSSCLIGNSSHYQSYQVEQSSLPHLEYDLGSNHGSTGTSPTESYLDGFRSAEGQIVSEKSECNWQDFNTQDLCCEDQAIFNPSHTLHLQPMDVKINMHEHDEIFEFMPDNLQYPLFQTPTMMLQQPIHDIKQEVALTPICHPISTYPACEVQQPDEKGPTTPPPPPDDCSDTSSEESDCETATTSPNISPPTSLSTSALPDFTKRKVQAAKPQAKPVFGPVEKNDSSTRKVGCRRGPLRPDQRKRASETRRVRACIRCRFLKKTCDPGTPCAGCQPHHARLWQVPCTRLDVRDLGYFMCDWKDDVRGSANFPEQLNIYGRSTSERTLYIGHGFDYVMPVAAHEVFVNHEKNLLLTWTETHHRTSKDFAVKTASMSVTSAGIDKKMLADYLDRHLDGGWTRFVDQHFEGTPFLTEMLKTANNYYLSTNIPIVRSALKLVLVYNLTLHISIVEGPLTECTDMPGRINDPLSKYHGKIATPTLINHHLKHALSKMWRDIHKDVLEELSAMISGVYGRDKLKNWPTIFMVTYLVLSVWEQLRFDAIRRCRDMAEATKFCENLDGVPVGVVVGLFAAISQKLPSFKSWSTFEHHDILGNDAAACDVMEAVREHVLKHGMLPIFDTLDHCE